MIMSYISSITYNEKDIVLQSKSRIREIYTYKKNETYHNQRIP